MRSFVFFIVLFSLFAAPEAHANFDKGLKAYNARHWRDAIVNLRPLADKGDARAMILIGNMYRSGYGVLINRAEAMKLYKRAAIEKNNPQAMNAVAAMYVDGQGTFPSLETALAWFERSASLGNQTGALFSAIILYEGNRNIFNKLEPDLTQSYKWYKICASEKQNAGYAKVCARAVAGLAKKFLKTKEVARLDKQAAAWKPLKAKDLGPPPPDPKKLSQAEIRKRISRMLKHPEKHAVRPDRVLP